VIREVIRVITHAIQVISDAIRAARDVAPPIRRLARLSAALRAW
jgi:hypothetical protein